MKTIYKVVIKDTHEGIRCTLFGRYFFIWCRLDRTPAYPVGRHWFDMINRQIDDWDRLMNSVMLIENKSNHFILAM
jgi:hypothetical protein